MKEKLCRCGHPKKFHRGKRNQDGHNTYCWSEGCQCQGYVPEKEAKIK